MSPLVGVAVLEGKTGLSEAREFLGKLWDRRSGTCQPSAWKLTREDGAPSERRWSRWLLFRFGSGV